MQCIAPLFFVSAFVDCRIQKFPLVLEALPAPETHPLRPSLLIDEKGAAAEIRGGSLS